MQKVYMHNGSAYVILNQKPVHYFSNNFESSPDIKYVHMFMQAVKADHVLRTQTHFLFCETIQDAEILN
jgi:hypothetical protein